MMNRHQRILRMTLRALLVVIVLLQSMIPWLGNIPLGLMSITILPVTIAIIAIAFGPGEGALLGGLWGVITWIRAFVYPTSALAPLIFTNPVIAVVPRILVGVVAGYAFRELVKLLSPSVSAAVAGLLASLTNTGLVLGLIYLFFNHNHQVTAAYGQTNGHLAAALFAIVTTNGLVEAAVALILTGLIAPAVWKVVKKLTH